MGTGRRPLNPQTELAPFHTLIKLIEQELEFAGRGELDQLDRAVAATGAHLASLPYPPPQSALALIERARALRARVTIETERLADAIALGRASHQRRRRVARTYNAGRSRQTRYSASA